ncbi:MAG: RnfABCDGE type electron transport complex subunit D, partial [Firmicutes bacterium]|nr:RnfABCDGE type electron transport complex subunit D [Bacillota bacterium]
MERRTGPYLRSPVTIESTMRDVLISLLPALAAGVVFFGLRALWLVILSTAAAMVTEMLLLRRPFTREGLFGDGSAAVTGVLVGLILPSTASWWVPVVGSIIAIAVVKLPFGGLGYNIFNPALGARAILLLAFTSQMVRFALPFDTVTGATPLLTMTSFDWSLIWGNVGGSIGETSVIAILLGAAYLFYKGHIDWRIPVGYVGAAFVMALLWGLNPWITVFAGGLLFGAVFMATDMVTSPVTPMGQLLFGIGCGVLTVFIRKFTSLPEGVTFAILGMNALVPILDKLTMPQRFGVGIPREQRFQGTAVGVVVTAAVVLLAVIIATPGQEIQPVFSGPHYLPIVEMLGTSDYSVEEINGTRYYTVRDGEGTLKAAVFAAEQRGFHGPIQFLVALDDQFAITDLRVLEHKEDPGLGALVAKPDFLSQFVGLNVDSAFSLGTDVDGISGATISSRAMATGVRRALEGFMDAFFPTTEAAAGWSDGVYTGVADSFGGPLTVEVVVTNGQIADVRVLSSSDTPGISDGAIANVPGRIVAANSPKVDAYSGATVTSEAIMSAVEKALSQAAADVMAGWPDGTYTGSAAGFSGQVEVEVTVSGGQIIDVRVVSHSDTPGISDSAINAIPGRIVEANSPDVDVVSGATYTSEGIIAAVRNALDSQASAGEAPAEQPSSAVGFDIKVSDGTYRAVGKGFGGDLVVDVTVAGGKINAISVVEHADTPFLADPAIEALVPAILDAQGVVDVYSGATMTSKGLFEAVEKAVSGAGEAEVAAKVEPFDIKVSDGT